MKARILGKGLAVTIILLFIGIAVQPSIATVPPERIDVEYIYITTEFVGFDSNLTIQLTREEIDELDVLFDLFRDSLNNSQTYEATVEIYNDMILQLDGYGLLGEYSIKQVQELAIGRFQKPRFNRLLSRLYNSIPADDDINVFSLIAGRTTMTYILPPSSMIFNKLLLSMIHSDINFPGDLFLLLLLISTTRVILTDFLFLTFTLGSGIGLGGFAGYDSYSPAKGWVYSLGINGQKNWEGPFYGHINEFGFGINNIIFIGAIGFKGIRINLPLSSPIQSFYLGFANYVDIDYKKPF